MRSDVELLITFSTTRFRELRRTWKAYDTARKESQLTEFGTTRTDAEYCGGRVVLLSWNKKKIICFADVPRASGICNGGEQFYVGAYDRIVEMNHRLETLRQFDSPRFNNLHGLCKTPYGFAAASTGIDTVLFLDPNLVVYDSWCAMHHGFVYNPLGHRRHVDLSIDHRKLMYPTLLHTTHLNSLLWVDGKRNEPSIYATFFHQGTVERIGIKTRDTSTVIDQLRAPHAIGCLSDGRYIVADSYGRRAVIWNEDCSSSDVEIETIRFPECDWLQDIKESPAFDSYFLADCNNCRILQADRSGHIKDQWCYSSDWKIQELLPIAP